MFKNITIQIYNMIVLISWTAFKLKLLLSKRIYVRKTPENYEFYTYDGPIIIKAVFEIPVEQEQEIMFVDKYLTRDNIIEIHSIIDSNRIPEPEPEVEIEPEDVDQEELEPEQEGGLNELQ